MPYIPQINEKLKKAFTRNNVSFHCSAGPKLGNILSAPNKTKFNPLDKKGIYKVNCSCYPNKCFVGRLVSQQEREWANTMQMFQDMCFTSFKNLYNCI